MLLKKHDISKQKYNTVIKEAQDIKENILKRLSYHSGEQIITNIAFTSAENSLLIAVDKLLNKYEEQIKLVEDLQKEKDELNQQKLTYLIQIGVIDLVSTKQTDTKGHSYEAVYKYKNEEYPVYLSAHYECTFAEQAAKQIWDCMTKEQESEQER